MAVRRWVAAWAAFVASPPIPGPVAAAAEASAGCGREFLERLRGMVDVSEALAEAPRSGDATVADEWAARQPTEEEWSKCGSLAGRYALVQFDVPRFTARGISRQPSESKRRGLQMLDSLGRVARGQMLAGMFVCVPRSCSNPEELSPVAMLYFMCLAGHCASVSDLDEPLRGVELNVTLLPEAPGGGGPAADAGRGREAVQPAPAPPAAAGGAPEDAAPAPQRSPAAAESASGEAARPPPRPPRAAPEGPPEVCREVEDRPPDLHVRGHGRGAGCGGDFIGRLGEIIQISGELYAGAAGLPLDEDRRQRCRSFGRFARLQCDVLKWIDRSLSGRPEDSVGYLQTMRKFYTEYATPSELASILGGIAFCLPASCVGSPRAELARVTMLYFASVGTNGQMHGAAFLEDPLWGEEMNLTWPCGGAQASLDAPAEAGARALPGSASAPGVPAAEQPSALAGAVKPVAEPCREAWERGHTQFRGISGAHANFGQDENMGLFYAQEEECRSMGGHYIAARFNLTDYLALDHRPLSQEAKVLLDDLGSLLEANQKVAANWHMCGVGLCIPQSCSQEDPGPLHQVVLESFVNLAGIDRAYTDVLPKVPPGPVGLDVLDFGERRDAPLRVLSRFAGVTPPSAAGPWQLWSSGPSPEPAHAGAGGEREALQSAGARCGGRAIESATSGCARDEVYVGPWGDCRCLPRAQGIATAAAAPFVPLAEWPDCGGPGFAPEWRLLRETIQGAPGDPSLDLTVVTLSDALARRYAWRAVDWASRSYQIVNTCSMSYVYIEENPFPGHAFVPTNLFFVDEADPRWASEWAHWRQFCMTGYAAALYFRARAFELVGLPKAAMEDLHMALQMLGPCRELDFLERRIWRVSSLDVETNLMRLRGRAPDGRPVFAHGERPRGWLHFRSFTETFPTKGQIARSYVWSALRQNLLYRRFYRRAAAECSAEVAERTPALALLSWPPVFSVFVTPQVFRIWPDAKMVFFHLGPFDKEWEKCPECREEMRHHVAKEQRLFQDSVPMKRDKLDPSKLSIEIDWNNEETGNFGYSEFVLAMRGTFQLSAEFAAASVLMCSGHLWFCATVRMVTEKPMLILDLANPNQGRPPDMKERWYVVAARNVLELRAPTIRTVVVRDELLRSVLPTKGCTNSMDAEMDKGEVECYDGTWEIADFVPFVAMPSLYVRPRWQGPPAPAAGRGTKGPFLVMREGSAGKFSKTMHGQHFFAMLKRLAEAASLDMTFLVTESTRVPFKDLAKDYRAAIAFLGITNAKRTPHDIYMLEIPFFFPSKALNAAALGSTGYYAAAKCDDGPWRRRSSRDAVPPLCSWVRTAFQLELSSFYRMPHLFLFESASDLAYRLGTAGDDELRRVSSAMREFTRQRVEDDGRLWRDAILGMACAPPGLSAELPRPAHAGSSDPRCLFGLPSADGGACCAIACGTCEEAGCEALPLGREDCCPGHVAALAPCSEAAAPCALRGAGAPPPAGGCEEDPRLCPAEVLLYATHLEQRIVVAQA